MTTQTLPRPVHFQGTWHRYHALLLASDASTGRSKIALCDWIMGRWWMLWVQSERVLPATTQVKASRKVAA